MNMKRILFLAAVCMLAAACNDKIEQGKDKDCKHTKPVAVAPGSTNFDYFAAGEYMKELYGVVDMKPAGRGVRPYHRHKSRCSHHRL